MSHEKILVLDFGGQYNQLIARRVRDHHVYAEIKSFETPLEEIKAALCTAGAAQQPSGGARNLGQQLYILLYPLLKGYCIRLGRPLDEHIHRPRNSFSKGLERI